MARLQWQCASQVRVQMYNAEDIRSDGVAPGSRNEAGLTPNQFSRTSTETSPRRPASFCAPASGQIGSYYKMPVIKQSAPNVVVSEMRRRQTNSIRYDQNLVRELLVERALEALDGPNRPERALVEFGVPPCSNWAHIADDGREVSRTDLSRSEYSVLTQVRGFAGTGDDTAEDVFHRRALRVDAVSAKYGRSTTHHYPVSTPVGVSTSGLIKRE